MQFRSTYALAKWMVVGLLFFLSLFHYYTAGFGVLTHHWHVGFHLAFVLGLIYLVYTPHRAIGSTEISDRTTSLMIRWPDFIKIGVPSLFTYGMMGFVPAILLFSYFAIVVHFSRHYSSSRDMSSGLTTDYVLLAMIALFALHMTGVVTGYIDSNLWGKNGVPPAIRIGAAIMMLTMAIEARRRMPVVIVIFAAIAYYFGGGIGDFTWGLENNGLYLITTVSFLTLLISLDPIVRGVAQRTSAEAKAIDASRHGGVPFYDWFLFVLIAISSLRRRDL